MQGISMKAIATQDVAPGMVIEYSGYNSGHPGLVVAVSSSVMPWFKLLDFDTGRIIDMALQYYDCMLVHT